MLLLCLAPVGPGLSGVASSNNHFASLDQVRYFPASDFDSAHTMRILIAGIISSPPPEKFLGAMPIAFDEIDLEIQSRTTESLKSSKQHLLVVGQVPVRKAFLWPN